MSETAGPIGIPCDCRDCGGSHHPKGKRCEELVTDHDEMDTKEKRCLKCKAAVADVVALYSPSGERDH